MSDHPLRQSDNEDEDLELLRNAALKSLNVKKESSQSSQQYHRSPNQTVTKRPHETYAIPVKQSSHDASKILTVPSQSYYPPNTRSRPLVKSDKFATRQRLEQLDINEPYVPQHVAPTASIVGPPAATLPSSDWIAEPPLTANNYAPYIPHKVNDTIPVGNVQLSPRSLAFVAQNNDILMRRKGEAASPSYAYRSLSPHYRPVSPDRWSKSPSPPAKVGSRSPPPGHRMRPHHYLHRRSMSRSPPPNRPARSPPPVRQRSPVPRRRSISRSPRQMQHNSRHQSPNPFHRFPSRSPPLQPRRIKSRSPPPPPHGPKHKQSPPSRHMSRSPHNRRPRSRSPVPGPNIRRSPGQRLQPIRNRRSPSPMHTRKRSPGGNNNGGFHEPESQRMHPNRGRSPLQHPPLAHRRSMSPRPHRSLSRSPQRRPIRRSRDRNINGNQPPARRRSPYASNRRRFDGPPSNFRNRGRKRSASPPPRDRQRKSRSRSPVDRNRRFNKRPRRMETDERGDLKFGNDRRGGRTPPSNVDASRKDTEKVEEIITSSTTAISSEETIDREVTESFEQNAKSSESVHQPARRESSESDEESKTDDDEEDDDDDDDNDDGIDLFASEESESENEGRFKSSAKNERDTQAPTLSFTKLGESLPVEVKPLNDIDPTKDRDTTRNDRNRNRDRGRDRMRDRMRNNYRRSRDRFRNLDGDTRNSRGTGVGERRRNDSRNRRDRDMDRGDWNSPANRGNIVADERRISDKPMFKSTFQTLDNEGSSSRRNSRDREIIERRKRRNISKDRKVSPDMETEQISSTVTVVSSSIVTAGNSATAGSSSSTRISSRSKSPPRDAAGDTVTNEPTISGKKPIHLRLGAKTNTFKPAKKTSPSSWITSTTEKV